tara:strand:+ start:246 stop:374 length:129 start_codon:yes stop_codon:yes gene_type:complete
MTQIEIAFFLIGMIIGMLTTLIIYDLAEKNVNKHLIKKNKTK